MLQAKVFKLDKYKESPEQCEARINKWIESTGDVSLASVNENVHNGDVVFVFMSHGEKKSITQELHLMAWSDLETLEGAVNNALSGIEENGRRGRYVHFLTTAKSARALAVFVVEGNRLDLTSCEPELSSADVHPIVEGPEKKKQDQAADAKPKRSRKSKVLT